MESRRPSICVFSPSPLVGVTIEARGDSGDEIHFHAAGQGVWVARMIRELGVAPVLCSPVGGESGNVLRTLLAHEEIALRSSAMQASNGAYVNDRRGGERAQIANLASAALTRHEIDDLYTAALHQGLESGVAVLTGPTHERVIDPETIARLARDLASNGVQLVADVSGPVLRGLDAALVWLKVSHEELIHAGYAASDDAGALARGLGELARRGARNVVVSRAEEPALASIDGEIVEVRAPELEAREPRGAGDSMTAALATATSRGLPPRSALRLAAAAGALNVTRHGLGTGRREAIESFAERIEVRTLARGSAARP